MLRTGAAISEQLGATGDALAHRSVTEVAELEEVRRAYAAGQRRSNA
jgi:hypothetical protein